MAKKLWPNKLNGKGHNRREMQLRDRAGELPDEDVVSGDPCRDGTCPDCYGREEGEIDAVS